MLGDKLAQRMTLENPIKFMKRINNDASISECHISEYPQSPVSSLR